MHRPLHQKQETRRSGDSHSPKSARTNLAQIIEKGMRRVWIHTHGGKGVLCVLHVSLALAVLLWAAVSCGCDGATGCSRYGNVPRPEDLNCS